MVSRGKVKILTSDQNLLDAADDILIRERKTGGNLTKSGILADLASGLAGRSMNWGSIVKYPFFASEDIPLKGLLAKADGGPPSYIPPHPKMRLKFMEPVGVDFKSKLLALAAQWQDVSTERMFSKKVVCTFGNIDVIETELVYVADLLTAINRGTLPIYRESSWKLMRPWSSHSCEGYIKFTPGVKGYLLPRIMQEFAFEVPMDPGTQMRLILEFWVCQKFGIVGDDYGRILEEFLRELGWMVSSDDQRVA
jgi:hypothetical protein